MSKTKLTKKEEDFCRLYVALRNPLEAAKRAGIIPLSHHRVLRLMSKKHIVRKIQELEKERPADNALVCAGLERLAFGSVSDAVRLILCANDNITPDIDSFDLFNVSEIKITSGKGMEIKFFDRLKALEKLASLTDNSGDDGALSFYEAIERSAMKKSECGDNG